MKVDALIDTIKRSIATGASTPVRIVDRTVLLDIIEPEKNERDPGTRKPKYRKVRGKDGHISWRAAVSNTATFLNRVLHSPFLNMIILVSALLMAALVIVAMVSFFLRDVLLPNTSYSVNDRGALAFNQPLKREQYMFLLNTAVMWADSGIEILEGDKVTITVSGTFYSDIHELVTSARDNSMLSFAYYDQRYTTGPGSPYTMMPEKPFGVLLYQIQTPGHECDITGLDTDSGRCGAFENNMTQNVSFTSKASGILHFSVNDIPITGPLLDTLTNPGVPERIRLSQAENEVWKSDLTNHKSLMARKWFDDNCGEILVNVQITRDLSRDSGISLYDKVFIYIVRFLDSF